MMCVLFAFSSRGLLPVHMQIFNWMMRKIGIISMVRNCIWLTIAKIADKLAYLSAIPSVELLAMPFVPPRKGMGFRSLYIRSREFAVMLCLGLLFLSTDVDGRILKKRIFQGIVCVIRSSGSRQGDESSSAGENLVLFGSEEETKSSSPIGQANFYYGIQSKQKKGPKVCFDWITLSLLDKFRRECTVSLQYGVNKQSYRLWWWRKMTHIPSRTQWSDGKAFASLQGR